MLSHNAVRATVWMYQGNGGSGIMNAGLRDRYCNYQRVREAAEQKATASALAEAAAMAKAKSKEEEEEEEDKAAVTGMAMTDGDDAK